MGIPSMKDLLEAGVHFGHQTRKWNPKMKPYIFQERNGIYIIDLLKTIEYIKAAYNTVKELARNGGEILFVGTKKQASKGIEEAAKRCGMHYVSNRWLGGILTNFETITQSIQKLKRIERQEVDGTFESITKKERVMLLKQKERLEKNLAGIKDMERLPDMMFIVDPVKEGIAVSEAKKSHIPIVAVIDTNCDPDPIDHPIPGNDDAIRALSLFADVIADAVIEGHNEAGKEVLAEQEAAAEEEAAAAPEEAPAPVAGTESANAGAEATTAAEAVKDAIMSRGEGE